MNWLFGGNDTSKDAGKDATSGSGTELGMGWKTQADNADAKVQVSGSYSKDGTERTDILVIDKAAGTHDHRSYDGQTGQETVHHDSNKTS